ncbi:unnamed protein product [marine sediment metagenome]|uniref:Uncharacterized protein n=1 Tax=marine sediment metagenome TaxID=412755 RepID=X1E8M0_9ZZZZ
MIKKLLVFSCLFMFVVGLIGCTSPTTNNPLGFADPNQVQVWFNAGVESGQALQAVGVATGNPAMMGYGAALAILSAYLATIVIRKEKKDGES